MSDWDGQPEDLFDAVCRLDVIAEWLEAWHPEEAVQLHALSDHLKGSIVLSVPDAGKGSES